MKGGVLAEVHHQLRFALPLWMVLTLTEWLPENRITIRLRGALAAPFLRGTRRRFSLGRGCTLLGTHRLEIGDDVYLARGCWINANGGLAIEDEVVVSPYVVMSTSQHVFRDASVRFGGSIFRPIRVGRGSWIASHATVRCGVTIGAGSVIAANSAVTDDIPDGVVAGGVPAKVLGRNTDRDPDGFGRWSAR